MNAALLLDHYARIADAPDAIARLRRFVLDLAVRGKVVEQDAGDEPASELLQQIAAEKARLVRQKAIKKSEVPEITPDETPYPLPSNWQWGRLGDIGDWGAGSTPSRGNTELYGGGVTWLKSGELNDNRALAGSEETVTEAAVRSGSFRLNQPGDVLIAMYGATIGKVAILAEPAVTNQAVCGCTPFTGVANQYLFLFLLSQREQFHSASEGGAQPNISKVKIVNTPVPIPPLAEQHRIVAKVDELMALCDQLEVARAAREAARDTFALSTLARLNTPDPETFAADARFTLANLAPLTTRADQIKQLRQTILNLAVRGKLAEQDPSESSPDIRSVNAEAKAPFALPTSWRWAEFSELATFENGDRSSKYPNRSDYVSSGVPWINTGHIKPDGTLSSATMHYITEKKFASLGGGKIIPGDLVYCLRGATFGKTAFVEPFDRGAIASSLMIIRPGRAVDRRFVYFFLISPFGREQLRRFDNGTAQPNLSSGNVKRYLVPLPPLAQQHRIVAKVDELMALCDHLEASLTTGELVRSRLLESVLHHTLEPA
jgi:type I restriction enzyme S subunit